MRSNLVDLIRNDVKIDKMAMFSVGTSYVITKMSLVCRFHDMKILDNKGKRLVSMIWRCKIVPPDETRLKFYYQHKTTCIYLMYASPFPLLQYANINKAN